MVVETMVPARPKPRRVKIHLHYRDMFPWNRICDGKNNYDPHIAPGDLVVVCDACALKVVQDGQEDRDGS